MTEKNDQKMDSTTEEEEENLLESEEQETQLDPKHRTPALANLIAGYALALGFGILLAMGMGVFSDSDSFGVFNKIRDEAVLRDLDYNWLPISELPVMIKADNVPWKIQ